MREIKFRCWDGRCMLYFDLQDIEASDSLSHGKEFQLNDTLMQFTGLKDKNGKEIYEGDVVSEGSAVAIVHFDDIGARYEYKTKTGRAGLCLFTGEVIGNIYDNPELVGGTQKGLDLEG